LLEISSDLKLFSNSVEKLDTQIGNLREETWWHLSICQKDDGLRLMLSILINELSQKTYSFLVGSFDPARRCGSSVKKT
jgi:hypothetical protein